MKIKNDNKKYFLLYKNHPIKFLLPGFLLFCSKTDPTPPQEKKAMRMISSHIKNPEWNKCTLIHDKNV